MSIGEVNSRTLAQALEVNASTRIPRDLAFGRFEAVPVSVAILLDDLRQVVKSQSYWEIAGPPRKAPQSCREHDSYVYDISSPWARKSTSSWRFRKRFSQSSCHSLQVIRPGDLRDTAPMREDGSQQLVCSDFSRPESSFVVRLDAAAH